MEKLYQWIWKRIGGRPWTYIIRDTWHKYEFFWIVGLVCLGVWLGHNYPWNTIITGWLLFSAGFIAGHFFWGTEYIPGQTGNEQNDEGDEQ